LEISFEVPVDRDQAQTKMDEARSEPEELDLEEMVSLSRVRRVERIREGASNPLR
jgi:hypothetical protein